MSTIKFDELVRSFNNLRQLCYQNFAVRITNIEDYLSTLTDRVIEGKVIVNGDFESEKVSRVNISESQLVQVYNDVPQVLGKNSVVLELTAKSYRNSQDGEPIFLENDKNGKYWLITTDIDQFFVVPSMNVKLNIHKLKTVKMLFDFSGDESSADSDFILVQPAKVSSQATGKEWKLQERGMLEFNSPVGQSPDFQLNVENSNLEIKKMAKQLDDLKIQFHDSQQERIKLQLQVEEIANKLKWLD
ncbi:MAG: hypothetical protein NWQ28_03325 [Nodularia sp. (in: cyanobacteria)]|nr:hypothetical protein [Nodularia sp. (in: cyanobacteria)]